MLTRRRFLVLVGGAAPVAAGLALGVRLLPGESGGGELPSIRWGEATCAENGIIRKTASFDSKATMVEMETAIAETIWATPERMMREKALENALVPVIDGQTHPKKYNFSIALNYSPLIRKGKSRGQYIPNGSI